MIAVWAPGKNGCGGRFFPVLSYFFFLPNKTTSSSRTEPTMQALNPLKLKYYSAPRHKTFKEGNCLSILST